MLVSCFCIRFLRAPSKEYQEENDYSLNMNNPVTSDSGTQFKLDLEYESKKKNVKSNIEMTALNEEYAEKWKSKIEFYHTQILNYYTLNSGGEMYDLSMQSHTNWNSYEEQQYNYYEAFIYDNYTTGSIIPIKLSDYKRIVYRNRAIELYNRCIDLLLEVELP